MSKVSGYRTVASRYRLITSAHFAVRANGGHGERGDGGDNSRQEDDDDGLPDSCLANHPRQSQEDHHPENVEQTSNLQQHKT